MEDFDNVRLSTVQGTNFEDDRFYSERVSDGLPELKKAVAAWMGTLSKLQKSDESRLFIEEMLRLVELMLKVEAKDRIDSGSLVHGLEQILEDHCKKAEQDGAAGIRSNVNKTTDPYPQLNESYSLAWDRAVGRNLREAYKAVHVPLLYWGDDDLQSSKEVETLGTVFREIYNFEVAQRPLATSPDKRVQLQANKIVGDWIYDCDGPNNLLISYYGGYRGSSQMTGELETSPALSENHTIIWRRINMISRTAESDVLQIFDCNVPEPLHALEFGETRRLEYLTAAPLGETTMVSERGSFTLALIMP